MDDAARSGPASGGGEIPPEVHRQVTRLVGFLLGVVILLIGGLFMALSNRSAAPSTRPAAVPGALSPPEWEARLQPSCDRMFAQLRRLDTTLSPEERREVFNRLRSTIGNVSDLSAQERGQMLAATTLPQLVSVGCESTRRECRAGTSECERSITTARYFVAFFEFCFFRPDVGDCERFGKECFRAEQLPDGAPIQRTVESDWCSEQSTVALQPRSPSMSAGDMARYIKQRETVPLVISPDVTLIDVTERDFATLEVTLLMTTNRFKVPGFVAALEQAERKDFCTSKDTRFIRNHGLSVMKVYYEADRRTVVTRIRLSPADCRL